MELEMAGLSKSDAAFLQRYGIDLDDTFDGSAMSIREIRDHMRAHGKLIAYGKHCKRGHSIRAAGGCVRCNTGYIEFGRRARKSGYIYIAKSASQRLIKVGFSTDPDDRVRQANFQRLANANDWELRYTVFAANAARIEIALKDFLKEYLEPIEWVKSGAWTVTTEVYGCTLASAHRALLTHLDPDQAKAIRTFRTSRGYQF